MNAHVIGLGQVGRLGALLGQGGQAKVHLAPHVTLPDVPGPLVYKEYKPGHAPPHGLGKVVARRLRLDPAARERLDRSAAWPVRVVEHGGAVCGVLMPLIPDSYFEERVLPSGTPTRTLREVQHLFIDPARASRLGMPAPTAKQRIRVCRDLAGVVDLLHRNDLVIGDVNAKNAVFRLTGDPLVMLVDCDAIRVKGEMAVVRQLNAPDWQPPEDTLSQATDLYKLGLFVLRCLAPGAMASLARDPSRAYAALPGEGRELLRDAVSTTPGRRTAAAAWVRYFDGQLTGADSCATTTAGWKRDPVTRRWIPVS